MLAAVTKITLPSCLGFHFQIFLIYTTAPRATHAKIFEVTIAVLHAEIYSNAKLNKYEIFHIYCKELAICATLDRIKKNG